MMDNQHGQSDATLAVFLTSFILGIFDFDLGQWVSICLLAVINYKKVGDFFKLSVGFVKELFKRER